MANGRERLITACIESSNTLQYLIPSSEAETNPPSSHVLDKCVCSPRLSVRVNCASATLFSGGSFIIFVSGPPLLLDAARGQSAVRQLGGGEAPHQATPAPTPASRQ